MAVMGAVWIVIALHTLPLFLLVACALLPALIFIIWGLIVIRAGSRMRAREAPLSEAEVTAESTLRKRFAWIFGGEGVAIFIAVDVLANIGGCDALPSEPVEHDRRSGDGTHSLDNDFGRADRRAPSPMCRLTL
jgi:hypothetical protein